MGDMYSCDTVVANGRYDNFHKAPSKESVLTKFQQRNLKQHNHMNPSLFTRHHNKYNPINNRNHNKTKAYICLACSLSVKNSEYWGLQEYKSVFRQAAPDVSKENSAFICRGQGDSSWTL
jgi:hypothetical protein